MKVRFVAVVAVLIAAILLNAACNKGTSNNNTTTATNATTNAATGASPAAAANTAQPTPTATPITSASGSSPTEVFKAYYEANKTKNVAAFKRTFSKVMLDKMEERARQRNMTLDDLLAKALESASQQVPATLPEVRNEKIEGDTATLEFKDDKGDKWVTIHFVKEDGEWKFSSFN
ncbi:MAG TPA: hypothetical protein VF791_07865 [Pyrinomonadaceae bacterium]